MRRFAQLVRELDSATGTNEKTDILAAYLSAVSQAEAGWAVKLLAGGRRKRIVTSRTLQDVFLAESGMPPWLFLESRSHVGDTAETVTLLIQAGWLGACAVTAAGDVSPGRSAVSPGGDVSPGRSAVPPGGAANLADLPLQSWMGERIPALAALTEEQRAEQLCSWWRALPGEMLFTLNKALTGGFRLGVSKGTVAAAVAKAADVPAPAATQHLTGGIEPSDSFLDDVRELAQTSSQQPYPFYLASPLPQDYQHEEPLEAFRIEWKWDGIRAQIIKRDNEVSIWSRGEDLVTEQFPEVADAGAALPDGTVLDCELLAWEGERPRPFHHLQRRLGRKRVSAKMQKEVPVVAMVFDCLESTGKDIRALPLEERVARAEAAIIDLLKGDEPRFCLSTEVAAASWRQLEAMRQKSQEQNVEGFLLKRRGSAYKQGRKRGDWWKFKRDPFSLDAVLLYAQAGSGKRANLFTDYTFALRSEEGLVPFAKAYSGLSNAEIAELDKWIRQNTEERFGPVRQVAPEKVFEIGFEGIAPSTRHKSGVATRFPRILRSRPDKRPEQINTLEDARRLIP